MLPVPSEDVRKRALLSAVATKNRAEVRRVIVARRGFTARVLDDARIHELFTGWRRESRLDLVITAWGQQLDAATAHLRLPDRRTLLRDEAVHAARLPLEGRQFFDDCNRLFQIRLRDSLEARAAHALLFVDTVLFRQPPRMRAWLGLALLDAFEAEAIGEIQGESLPVPLLAGSLIPLPEKDGNTPDAEKIARNVDWFYRAKVAEQKVTHAALAEEYAAARAAAGVTLAPKDRRTIQEPADTKLVRQSIKDADRLLNGLTIPANDALRFLTTTTKPQ